MEELPLVARLHADGWRLWWSGPGALFVIKGGLSLDAAWERVCREHENQKRPAGLSGDRGWLCMLDPLLGGRWPLVLELATPN